jgi:hypothetical protein
MASAAFDFPLPAAAWSPSELSLVQAVAAGYTLTELE